MPDSECEVSDRRGHGEVCGDTLSMVELGLRVLSPCARAAAKSAIESAVATAVEEFSSSRAHIVARAEDEIAGIRARMEEELHEEDARHASRMHAAVVAALRRVEGASGACPESL